MELGDALITAVEEKVSAIEDTLSESALNKDTESGLRDRDE